MMKAASFNQSFLIAGLLILLYTVTNASTDNACGGHLKTEEGTIQSPNYPKAYPNSKTCVWILTSPNHAENIRIKFNAFDLEDGGDICKYDYVVIRDGSSAAAPLLGKYCGNNIPQRIWASSNQIFIKFVSDAAGAATGFELSYVSLPNEEFPLLSTPLPTGKPEVSCGGLITGRSGSITPPGFPGNYAKNVFCQWHVKSPGPSTQIQLRIVFIDIEQHVSCQYDHLVVKNSPTDESALLKMCGVQDAQTIYGNEFFIEFKSDGENTKSGFKIEWVVVNKQKIADLNNSILKGNSDCITEQNGFIGMVTSPGYPENYKSNTSCNWIITSETSTFIQLRFTDFSLERSDTCAYDFIEIYDGFSSNTQLIGRYCGNDIPDVIESKSNQLYLHFETDSADTRRGFEATWIALSTDKGKDKKRRQAEKEKCGGELTGKEGVIESPNYPLKYPASSHCDWVIKTDAFHSIVLTFESFDLEQHSECRYDYVIVKDGADLEAKPLGTLCGRKSPKEIRSTGSALQVSFVSDTLTQRNGFRAKWKIERNKNVKPSECGGSLTGETGVITSPDYPKSSPDRTICAWTVTVPEGGRIRFEFIDIDVKDHPNCGKGYIQVRNGKLSTDDSLGIFCGFILPRPLVSKGNSLFVGFLSDGLVKSRGFQARWRTIYPATTNQPSVSQKGTKCGKTMSQESGYISRFNGQTNCTWTIEVPFGKVPTISFIQLDMADDPDCRRERVEVVYGGINDASVLVRACGQLKPRPVTAPTNVVYIRYTVFDPQQNSRMKLTWSSGGKDEVVGEFNTGSCGISSAPTKSVINGAPQGPGTLPWVVAIIGMFGRVHCGGAILSSKWILTAAHCFERLPWKSLWSVRAGEYNLAVREETEQTVGIRKMFTHHEYNPKTQENDIALLRLDQPLILNEEVKTVCLPSKDSQYKDGTTCSVAGWGARKFLRQPREPLVHVLPKLVNKRKCNGKKVYDGKIKDGMICAGIDGIDSCQGDGGSPLTCATNNKHYVTGVVSWGNGCAFPGKFGVYTDVRKYLDWITYVVESKK